MNTGEETLIVGTVVVKWFSALAMGERELEP